MRAIGTSPIRVLRGAPSPEIAAIQSAMKAALVLKRRIGRFAIYGFLEAIYQVYVDWKLRKSTKRSARVLTKQVGIIPRKGMSPIRVLIEATFPDADFKRKSRWVRALEYVYSEKVSPSQFRRFVRARGGINGCARLAVIANRKRRRPGGDWDD
jgi:hypothetical protein